MASTILVLSPPISVEFDKNSRGEGLPIKKMKFHEVVQRLNRLPMIYRSPLSSNHLLSFATIAGRQMAMPLTKRQKFRRGRLFDGQITIEEANREEEAEAEEAWRNGRGGMAANLPRRRAANLPRKHSRPGRWRWGRARCFASMVGNNYLAQSSWV